MDLRSRLSYFTAIEIPEITQAEKIEALSQSSRRKGFDLDKNSLQYIINHTSRSLSDLLGLIDDLDGYALKKKKKVTAALVRELLASRPHNSRK
jgi:DnaA family protein